MTCGGALAGFPPVRDWGWPGPPTGGGWPGAGAKCGTGGLKRKQRPPSGGYKLGAATALLLSQRRRCLAGRSSRMRAACLRGHAPNGTAWRRHLAGGAPPTPKSMAGLWVCTTRSTPVPWEILRTVRGGAEAGGCSFLWRDAHRPRRPSQRALAVAFSLTSPKHLTTTDVAPAEFPAACGSSARLRITGWRLASITLTTWVLIVGTQAGCAANGGIRQQSAIFPVLQRRPRQQSGRHQPVRPAGLWTPPTLR